MIKRTGQTSTPQVKPNVAPPETPTQALSRQIRKLADAFESKKATGTREKAQLTGDSGLPSSVLEALSPAERKQAQASPGLKDLTGGLAFRTLDSATQVRLVRSALANEGNSLQNARLAELAASPGFRAMSPAQRKEAIELFEAADFLGQGRLLDLAKRTVNGKPALLDEDAKGVTLLDRLHALATEPLNENLAKHGYTREKVLAPILEECANPGRINQSNRNTCTATSMQYMLCDTNPAEYARLMEGLLTGDGKVDMRGGQKLVLEQDSIAPDSATDRSVSERIFQSAMMEFANGKESYSNLDDKSRGTRMWLFDYDHTGLNADAQERGLEALFGRNFSQKSRNLVDLVSERSPTDTYVRMAWGEKKQGGHAVVVTRVENGRVYFRNPWGATSDPVGTTYQDPPRRLENGAIREESMSTADFERWCNGAIV